MVLSEEAGLATAMLTQVACQGQTPCNPMRNMGLAFARRRKLARDRTSASVTGRSCGRSPFHQMVCSDKPSRKQPVATGCFGSATVGRRNRFSARCSISARWSAITETDGQPQGNMPAMRSAAFFGKLSRGSLRVFALALCPSSHVSQSRSAASNTKPGAKPNATSGPEAFRERMRCKMNRTVGDDMLPWSARTARETSPASGPTPSASIAAWTISGPPGWIAHCATSLIRRSREASHGSSHSRSDARMRRGTPASSPFRSRGCGWATRVNASNASL